MFYSRFLARLGIKKSSKLDFGLPADEEDSSSSEHGEVRKQLHKTKRRLKTLVNVIEAQNILLRRLARKIDPGAEMDARRFDDISPKSMEEDQARIAADFLDGQLPKARETMAKVTMC